MNPTSPLSRAALAANQAYAQAMQVKFLREASKWFQYETAVITSRKGEKNED